MSFTFCPWTISSKHYLQHLKAYQRQIIIMIGAASRTPCHPILCFNNPEKEAFRKHCGKRRKCWLPAFSHFPTMFSTLSYKFYHLNWHYLPLDGILLIPNRSSLSILGTETDYLRNNRYLEVQN